VMKSNKGLIVAALVLLVLAVVGGCRSGVLDDGYQAGDGTRASIDGAVTVAELRDRYCTEGDSVARQLLLLAARSVQPDYPEDGICSDAETLVKILSDGDG